MSLPGRTSTDTVSVPAQPVAEAKPDLPPITSVCETAEFAPGAPKLNVTVVVFAWRRLASLQRTVNSLQSASYCGHVVPLKLFIDGGALETVTEYVHGIEWKYGPKTIHAYPSASGIRGMWINATSADIEDDEHVMPLEVQSRTRMAMCTSACVRSEPVWGRAHLRDHVHARGAVQARVPHSRAGARLIVHGSYRHARGA